MSEQLVKAMADMREDDALALTEEMLEGGTDPIEILGAGRPSRR